MVITGPNLSTYRKISKPKEHLNIHKCTLASKRTVINNSHQILVIFSFLSCI